MGDNPLTALPPAWLHDVTLAFIISVHATFLAGAGDAWPEACAGAAPAPARLRSMG
jgi:hypothetical protein